ncbi:MAG: MarR family transcriptional regulator [Ilumatobacteraceae bacterium]|nr:MarR family transcriptional regulator [Ilumatobacteraceae bacterium]
MQARVRSPLASFKRLHLTARAAADRCLAAEGVSAAQFGVLHLLAEDPGLTGAELARRSSVAAPSMNEMLAMLLRDGLITRAPDPRGGRGIQMFISESGRDALASGLPLLTEFSDELLAGIDPDRLADFFAVLDLVADRAEAHGRTEAS